MANAADFLKKRTAVRDWTQGNIIRNIWLLSWPIIVLQALYWVNLILELVWVGQLGAASIAGVGIGGFVLLLVVIVMSGFSMGERAMVARSIGAGDTATANHVTGQAFLIATVWGILVALMGVLLTGPVFRLFGLEAAAVTEGMAYLRIVTAGWITEAFWITSFSVMQASGDSLTPMKIAIFIRIVNLALCPFLVLGWWVFPRLGVSGAAITYIVVTGLGMVTCLWAFFSGQTRLRLTLRDFYPDFPTIKRILRVGFPASVMGLGKAFGDLIMSSLMIPFGTLALAAHNLVYRLESFINTPGAGMGNGAGVLIGQNLGARKPGQAAKSGWLAMGMAAGLMLVCGVVLLVRAESVIGLFNGDPELVKVGSLYLRIAVSGYLGMSIVFVMQNCISGSGDTLPPMLITLGMLWVVQIPLAFCLSRFTGLDVYGVRWAIVAGNLTGAAAYIIYFWRGRWKRKRV
jgi:putative MATE family efflux protein